MSLFCKAAEKSIDSKIAQVIINILCNLHLCLTFIKSKEYDRVNKASKKLEQSGFIYQGLRCFKYANLSGTNMDQVLSLLDRLQESTWFLRTCCCKGEPLAELIQDLLKSNNRLPMPIKAKLQTMLSSANGMASNHDKTTTSICRNCGTSASKNLLCSRCKTTAYCSRECQDWKKHKKQCKMETKAKTFTDREVDSHQQLLTGFLHKNYFRILLKAHAFCEEHGVGKQDILLEIDFYGDAPALRGEFSFDLVSGYIHDNRPNEKEWFPNDLWKGIKDKYRTMTPDPVLAVCHYPDDSGGAYRLGLKNQDTGLAMMSNEAMGAVGTANQSELTRNFGPAGMTDMGRQLLIWNPQRVLKEMN
ncbi:expressed unknown protein [Seminavis robusta]|uniref:MYND-type domain-containing protein n=1 Tax=Seminavis robusta TaxID=568900 RepID=A0A9N8DB76_9STRA|nr:expressed unknown protein [Seminavis robusta]|eukprot:Sro17_g012510.1 n/a (360) ;mRNA; r:134596-135763